MARMHVHQICLSLCSFKQKLDNNSFLAVWFTELSTGTFVDL